MRMKTFLIWVGMLVGVVVVAAEYPAADTLRRLDPRLTLPENVELLKQAGVEAREISVLLANTLHWWDPGAPDVSKLPADKAGAVKTIEAERQQARRAWWRDRLIGEVTARDVDALRLAADADYSRRLAAILSPDEKSEYLYRASPALAKVREWAWGLPIAEEKLFWLTEPEREWLDELARARASREQSLAVRTDADAMRLNRVRTALLVFEAPVAATYIRHADTDFDHWCRVWNDEAAFSPEKLLRVYGQFCDWRHARTQLSNDTSIPRAQERIALEQLRVAMRAKVLSLLGAEGYARFVAHELGAWLR